MTERFPYPTQEHINNIETIHDALDFETTIYRNGLDYRQGLVGIERMYEKTQFHQSILNTSRIVALALVAEGHEQYQHTMDIDFYRGSLMALHTIVQLQSKVSRQLVLNLDIYDKMRTEDGEYQLDPESLESLTRALHSWRMGVFVEAYNAEPAALQQSLYDAAKHMYEDISDAEANEQAFIAGFMMVKCQMLQLSSEPLPIPSTYIEGKV